MTVDQITFRELRRRLPSGVTIVTTVDEQGRRRGFTASAFTFLSWKPPQVLACLDRSADCHPSFATAEGFAVNILRAEHEELARRFATKGIDKFAGGQFEWGELRLPILRDALAALECRTTARLPSGDHTILVGEAVAIRLQAGMPAVLYDRRFWTLGEVASLPEPASRWRANGNGGATVPVPGAAGDTIGAASECR
jgi:flavin reductase ActVB